MNKKAATKEQLKKAIVKVSGLIEQVKSLLSGHTGNKNNPHGVTAAQIGAAAASHGTHVSYSSTAPAMDGTAAVGTASSVARSDHVHPTDTSRAAASHTHTPSSIGAAAASHSHTGYAAASHTHTAADVGALPSSGGKLTGNLTGQYITGTWLQTTANGNLGKAADKVAVQDASGWLYYRTPAQLRDDMGAAIKSLSGSITIPKTGWGSDSTATYPKYYDIAVTGVTTSDRASVDIAPTSMSAAVACGLCPVTETLTGKIRIRAASVPTATMTANYWIEKGA